MTISASNECVTVGLEGYGIQMVEQVPIRTEANPHNVNKILKTGPSKPDPDTTIWRYMRLSPVFSDLINNRCILFRQFKDLVALDKCEGRVIPGFRQSILCLFRQENPQLTLGEVDVMLAHSLKQLDTMRCLKYASCWIMAESESVQMWNDFAPGGVAIRTTVRKLKNAETELKNADKLSAYKVVYGDSWEELANDYKHDGIVLNRLFLYTKTRQNSYQNEVRFAIEPYGFVGWKAPNPAECPRQFRLIFKNLDWIDEVFLARSLSSKQKEISDLTDRYGLKLSLSEV